MRTWSTDHPKARLMDRKRALILAAARKVFIDVGYSTASMEAIANAAGVSIMTLYRHARTKDDLFQFVISEACVPLEGEDAQQIEQVLQRGLVDILSFIANRFQERTFRPDTLGLLRAVMVEHKHFPKLGKLAYDGLIGSHVQQMSHFLRRRPEARGLTASACTKLSFQFFDLLLGTDFITALLGIGMPAAGERRSRASTASRFLLAGLETAPRGEKPKRLDKRNRFT